MGGGGDDAGSAGFDVGSLGLSRAEEWGHNKSYLQQPQVIPDPPSLASPRNPCDRLSTLPRLIPLGAFILASLPGLVDAGDAGTVSFSRDVLPILSENCLLCHGPDAKARKADLRLDVKESALRTKEPIIVPGKSAESELIRRVESDDAEEAMPPPKSGHKLRQEQKETLRRWVDQGARWGKHWAFEPPGRIDPPRVKDAAWVRNPIDAFVLARLEEEGLKPSPEADRATL